MIANTVPETYTHVPVMPEAVIRFMQCKPGRIYVDCTLGGGGHSKRIVRNILPDGHLIAIDQDVIAIEHAQNNYFSKNMTFFHDNFKNIRFILDRHGIDSVDGIIADLGLSLFHIRQSGRGFSFMKTEPLDMRMNPHSKSTAKDLIANLSEQELADIFWSNGEERFSRRIAKAIVKTRNKKTIETTTDLCKVITDVIPVSVQKRQRIHPATRVFMALRIAVNAELESLEYFLDNVLSCLNPGGRVCIISFHSLEDRIIKQRMRQWEAPCTCPKDLPECICGKQSSGRCIVRKGIIASAEEIYQNPMARSARMRVFEKIDGEP